LKSVKYCITTVLYFKVVIRCEFCINYLIEPPRFVSTYLSADRDVNQASNRQGGLYYWIYWQGDNTVRREQISFNADENTHRKLHTHWNLISLRCSPVLPRQCSQYSWLGGCIELFTLARIKFAANVSRCWSPIIHDQDPWVGFVFIILWGAI